MASPTYVTGTFGKRSWPGSKLLSAPGTSRCSSGGYQRSVSPDSIHSIISVWSNFFREPRCQVAGEGGTQASSTQIDTNQAYAKKRASKLGIDRVVLLGEPIERGERGGFLDPR